MNDLSRTLEIFADGEPVTGFRRARLTGREALGLLPLPFLLQAWNLAEDDYLRLSRAGKVSVLHGGSLLAGGTVSSVYRRTVPEGTLTEAVFSPVLPLWEAPVSLSVEAGASVSETVRRILAASGTGISLLPFPGPDPVFSRGQAFFGRAAECVNAALSAASARGYLAGNGLCAVPASGLPVSAVLSEADLLNEPAFAGGLMVLRTRVVGWTVGKRLSVSWQGKTAEGLVTERSVSADNTEGCWQAELLAEVTG